MSRSFRRVPIERLRGKAVFLRSLPSEFVFSFSLYSVSFLTRKDTIHAVSETSAWKRGTPMAITRLIYLLAFLILGFSPKDSWAQAKPDFSNFEYYVTEDGAFGLYKPKGWTVGTQKYPNGRKVFTTDPNDLSYVSILFLEKIDQSYDSVSFASSTLKILSR